VHRLRHLRQGLPHGGSGDRLEVRKAPGIKEFPAQQLMAAVPILAFGVGEWYDVVRQT
jgi:hypothetical protein